MGEGEGESKVVVLQSGLLWKIETGVKISHYILMTF